MLGTLGHRVRAAALDFAGWAPSAGLLLLARDGARGRPDQLARSARASPPSGSTRSGSCSATAGFRLSLLHWVNDALLTVFFLVVGLEIKREFTVGHLASPRAAALPIAAALGGMVAPALIYVALIPAGPWSHGWGVPMATDTAFAVALIAMMGARVPVELRIFLTAAAIVDDIGAIIVVALFYSGRAPPRLRSPPRRRSPRAGAPQPLARLCGHALQPARRRALVLRARGRAARDARRRGAGALHPDAAAGRTSRRWWRRPTAILDAEARRSAEVLHAGPSLPALRALDAIHDRLESPADRLLRARRRPVELSRAADLRAGQRRRRARAGGARGPRRR